MKRFLVSIVILFLAVGLGPVDTPCYVLDELGWFYSPYAVEECLDDIYLDTGIRPYVVLKAHDPDIGNIDAWTRDYFKRHVHDEHGLLYVYFAEDDADAYVGRMRLVAGDDVHVSPDAFWDSIDGTWYGDMSTDEVVVRAFDSLR